MSPKTKEQFEKIRAEKRRIILDSAVKLFAEYGYNATTISMIARNSGVSKGLMYNYFKNKEDLLLKILEELAIQVVDLMNPDHDDEITTEEMYDFFSKGLDLLRNNIEHWRLFFHISTSRDTSDIILVYFNSDQMQKNKKLVYKYFLERFDNPETEFFLFTSILKGFVLDYVYNCDTYKEENIIKFKEKLVDLFIKNKK